VHISNRVAYLEGFTESHKFIYTLFQLVFSELLTFLMKALPLFDNENTKSGCRVLLKTQIKRYPYCAAILAYPRSSGNSRST